MSESPKILDEIVKAMTPPPNAPLSVVFESYSKAVQLLDKHLFESYKKGKADGIALERTNQVKKQQTQN